MDQDALARWARFGAVGFEFAGTIVASVIAGYYTDAYFGTAPLFTLLVTIGGMAGALYRLLWMLRRYGPHDEDAH